MQDFRIKLGENGRFYIPSQIRQQLHLDTGDEIILHVDDENMYISTPHQALKKLQDKVKYFMDSTDQPFSLVDQLIADRRTEALNEDKEVAHYE